MKRFLYTLSVLSIFAISSCSSDDNSTDNPTPISTSLVVGNWKMVTGITVQGGETFTEDLREGDCEYNYYDFRTNGTKDEVYHDSEDNCYAFNYQGTWVYDATDKTITTVDTEDNYSMVFEVIELSTSTMKIKLIEDDGLNPEDFGIEQYMILQK